MAKKGRRARSKADEPLTMEGANESDESEAESRPIINLDLESSSEDEDSDGSEEDDDGGSSDGGSDAKNAAGGAEEGSDDSSEDESSEDEGDDRAEAIDNAWGRSASSYYSGDTADLEIGQNFEEAIEEVSPHPKKKKKSRHS